MSRTTLMGKIGTNWIFCTIFVWLTVTSVAPFTAAPAMFSSLNIWDSSPDVYFVMTTPGTPESLIDIAAPKISWAGDYAVGNYSVSLLLTDGVNPGAARRNKI